MAQNDNVKGLKVILIIFAVMMFIYGFGFLFVPGILFNLIGGNPVEFGWVRWAGGVLIALGIGSLMASGNPENQSIFVTSMALVVLFGGLGMLYSWIMQEFSAAIWFIALSTCLPLIVSALLFWVRNQAKGIL